MAHFKLNEADEHFLEAPQGAVMVAQGVNGTETWIERDKDVTVRIVLQTAAFATADSATLQACIEIDGGAAKGEDGPAAADHHLNAMQSVQVVVKAGQRINFKAYPQATNCKVLRTVVYNRRPEIAPHAHSSAASPRRIASAAAVCLPPSRACMIRGGSSTSGVLPVFSACTSTRLAG